MGLDQYAYVVGPHKDNTDFAIGWDHEDPMAKVMCVMEWRKHPNLQGWMDKLYNAKADAQGYEGDVAPGGMYEGISINAVGMEPDGTKIEVDQEVTEQLNEVIKLMGEEMNKLTQSLGDQRVFNGQPIRLNLTDIEQLETAINRGELPPTTGFFFGDNSDDYYKQQDLKFIEMARKAINEGYEVYYNSSW